MVLIYEESLWDARYSFPPRGSKQAIKPQRLTIEPMLIKETFKKINIHFHYTIHFQLYVLVSLTLC